MDTRTKIVERAALLPSQPRPCLAKGWFDVLTAEHCSLLAEAKARNRPLVVLVYRETARRPAPLRGYDRAQMVAALAAVDRVCLCEEPQADSIAEDMAAVSVLDVDAVQQRDVVRDVLERHVDRR